MVIDRVTVVKAASLEQLQLLCVSSMPKFTGEGWYQWRDEFVLIVNEGTLQPWILIMFDSDPRPEMKRFLELPLN